MHMSIYSGNVSCCQIPGQSDTPPYTPTIGIGDLTLNTSMSDAPKVFHQIPHLRGVVGKYIDRCIVCETYTFDAGNKDIRPSH